MSKDIQTIDTRPRSPQAGMHFWVQSGSHWAIGHHYRITRTNSRSFYVSCDGATSRFLLQEWTWWLEQRMSEGIVFYRGVRLVDDVQSLRDSLSMTHGHETVDWEGRDRRFLRASKDVLKSYTLTRIDQDDGLALVEVSRGRSQYTVTAALDWSRPASCTCPDSRRGAVEQTAGFCKHSIAVMLAYKDLRCQLLDLML